MTNGVFEGEVHSEVLYTVECYGNETYVMNCSLSFSGNCSDDTVGVICQGMQSKQQLLLFHIM